MASIFNEKYLSIILITYRLHIYIYLLACKLLLRIPEMLWRWLIMKKALWYVVGAVFLLSTLVFAVDKPSSPVKADPVKTNIVKAAKMHATGKVTEISDASIKIERTVKGDVETMEFALEKPVKNIIVNDSVKIDYIEKDGKLIASRVAKVIFKKKEINPAEAKSASGKK
jgi:hypothetical protein